MSEENEGSGGVAGAWLGAVGVSPEGKGEGICSVGALARTVSVLRGSAREGSAGLAAAALAWGGGGPAGRGDSAAREAGALATGDGGGTAGRADSMALGAGALAIDAGGGTPGGMAAAGTRGIGTSTVSA
ncbi:MAG TPA: hypothetical protein VF710_15740 [Longimicrobium sp.]